MVDKSRRLIKYLYLPLSLIKSYKLALSSPVLLYPIIYAIYYKHLLLKRGRSTPTYQQLSSDPYFTCPAYTTKNLFYIKYINIKYIVKAILIKPRKAPKSRIIINFFLRPLSSPSFYILALVKIAVPYSNVKLIKHYSSF